MSAGTHQSTRDLLLRARDGDAGAREALVEQNIALVKYIVRRFLDRGAEYDDLFQYGCMGLLKAIDRFDPDYTVQFSTYAVPVIMGEIRRYLRDDGPIHVSRTIHERAQKVDEFVRSYTEEHGAAPGVGEISEALGLDRGDVLLALNSKRSVRSLDERIGGDSELCLKDVLGTESMEAVDRRLTLTKLLGDLTDEERTLIVRRYFQSHTQAKIARDMGTSQVQVSRMESRIIKRMRMLAGTDG